MLQRVLVAVDVQLMGDAQYSQCTGNRYFLFSPSVSVTSVRTTEPNGCFSGMPDAEPQLTIDDDRPSGIAFQCITC